MSLKAMTLADMEQHYIVLLYIQTIKPAARATVGCFVFHLAPFFSLWQAERSVWMCLPEAAACWGPEWGAFCLIVIRPDLLLLSLPPQTMSAPALWRRGWCVNSPPLRANLQLFGANTRKWPTSTFCTNDAQKKKKTLAQLVHGSVLITLILILSSMEEPEWYWISGQRIFFAERKRPY